MTLTKDQLLAMQDQYVLKTYSRDTIMTRGEGSYLWDIDGKRYLDFAMGISVCNLGHCHPAVTKAICEQAPGPGELSLEERMGCGFGACMGCTVITQEGPQRVCKEGPVFTREVLGW